jgi:hypothetical protein
MVYSSRGAAEVYYRKEPFLHSSSLVSMNPSQTGHSRSCLIAILTDIQFWIPFAVLLVGIVLLKFVV